MPSRKLMTQYPAQLRMKLSSVSSLNSAVSADLFHGAKRTHAGVYARAHAHT